MPTKALNITIDCNYDDKLTEIKDILNKKLSFPSLSGRFQYSYKGVPFEKN